MTGIRSSFVLLTILGTHAVGSSGVAAGPIGRVEGLIIVADQTVAQTPADDATRRRAEELAREASDRFTEIMKDKDAGGAPRGSGPSHRGQDGDVLAPVWDWLTQASKDYQGVIIAKLKNPSGAVALLAPSGTVIATSPSVPAATPEEPPRPELQPGWSAVVESVREWLASANRAYRTEIIKRLAQPLEPEAPARAVASAEPDASPRAAEAVPAAPEAKARAAEEKARPAEARTVPGETGATSGRDEEARRKADEAAAGARRKAEAEAEAALAAERRAEAEAEAKRKAEAAAEAKRKAEAEAALAAKRKADAEAELKRRTEAAAEAKRKAQAEAEEKRKAEAAAERQERVAAEAKRKADADAVAEAEAEAKREEEEAAQAAAEAERTAGAAAEETRIAEAPASSRAPGVAPPVKKDAAGPPTPEARKEAAPAEAKPPRAEAKRTRIAEVRKDKTRKHKKRAKRHRRPAGVIAGHGRRPRVYVHRYEEHGKIASRHYGRKHRARCKRVRYRAHSGRIYVVRRGDTLSGIAQRFYGRGRHYGKIYRANAGRIRNANLIYPRQRIYIP